MPFAQPLFSFANQLGFIWNDCWISFVNPNLSLSSIALFFVVNCLVNFFHCFEIALNHYHILLLKYGMEKGFILHSPDSWFWWKVSLSNLQALINSNAFLFAIASVAFKAVDWSNSIFSALALSANFCDYFGSKHVGIEVGRSIELLSLSIESVPFCLMVQYVLLCIAMY